jgi:Spy/CpxP family protein refolding chaperone
VKYCLILVIIGLALFALGGGKSSAEMCDCMGRAGGDMPMMGGMMHQGTGMMREGMGSDGMMQCRMEGRHSLQRHLAGLGLDEKQREAVKEIRSRVMKEVIRKQADTQIAQIDLRALLGKDPIDMRAVEAKLKQIEVLKTDVKLSLIRAREEMRSLLTPDQRKKLEEAVEMGHRAGGGPADPPGVEQDQCGTAQPEICGTVSQPGEKEERQPPTKQKHH